MNICSMVVHTRPEQVKAVSSRLAQMDGIEVHGETEEGKIIVTVERDERSLQSETMMQMQDVDGVLTTALVYEYHEEPEAALKEVSQ